MKGNVEILVGNIRKVYERFAIDFDECCVLQDANLFLDALASLKTMLDSDSVIYVFKITDYKSYRVLQSVRECYRVLQSVTECYRVLQSFTEFYRVLQSVTECYRLLQRQI